MAPTISVLDGDPMAEEGETEDTDIVVDPVSLDPELVVTAVFIEVVEVVVRVIPLELVGDGKPSVDKILEGSKELLSDESVEL